MTTSEKKSVRRDGSELLIVDNSDSEWKALQYLQEWTTLSRSFDIATGFFEVGSLLALDGHWQQLEKIRILMGDEITKRTKRVLLQALHTIKQKLDESIEVEKEQNDFLNGVPAIVEAIRTGKIACKVYSKKKFHAKAYITHAKHAVVGSSALVGSSNFTVPGLTENVELNVQLRREVDTLQKWYDDLWNEAEDVSEEILKTIERHTRQYFPFEVYAKAMFEYFKRRGITETDWEEQQSVIYPFLDQYQKDGYHNLLQIASKYRGAFLCDGVGLGKTFIGLMLIERLVNYDRKKVALFVPKSARESVWERKLDRYIPGLSSGVFNTFTIFNHTDLTRGGGYRKQLDAVQKEADVIIIDEAHNFRNPGIMGRGKKAPSRYWKMAEICEGKTVFLLTATPVNNHLSDLQHMIELFAGRMPDYFNRSPLGIHSLSGHFRKMEKALERILNMNDDSELFPDISLNEAEKVLRDDLLFHELVVQRSRAFVMNSQKLQEGAKAIFPQREDPRVVNYSLEKTYGKLLAMVEKAFAKIEPLFALPLYYPYAYYKGKEEVDPFTKGRQAQVVGLIRTLFLKRFESSVVAFEESCINLFNKITAFVRKYSITDAEKHYFERWQKMNQRVLQHIEEKTTDEGDEDDTVVNQLLEDVIELDPDEFNVEQIVRDLYLDMDQLVDFMKELMEYKPEDDDKLKQLLLLMKSDRKLQNHKVLIFTEYLATARYLYNALEDAGFDDIDEVDSMSARKRDVIIRQFAPYYNDSSSSGLDEEGLSETRILISTDVLSEGLNLQDATFMINYDLHWNPVRLMQRIGRVDRRYDPAVEEKIIADHPERKETRGKIAFWNFLPPDELNALLTLYARVTHKTLRISKTFGIEGRKLLKPDDEYEALREFNQEYEGFQSTTETLSLEYQKLMQDHPGLKDLLPSLPGRVFSGKQHPKADSKAVFFCYALPGESLSPAEQQQDSQWTEEAGITRWYLYDLDSESIAEEAGEIIEVIRSTPETPRRTVAEQQTLRGIRKNVERHIDKYYFRRVQAPMGVKPILKAWMEIT